MSFETESEARPRRYPGAESTFYKNVTVGGGPAPVRAYIDELLPDIRDGQVETGRVFDGTVDIDGVSDGYGRRPGNERFPSL